MKLDYMPGDLIELIARVSAINLVKLYFYYSFILYFVKYRGKDGITNTAHFALFY